MGEDFRRPDLWLRQLEHDAGSSTREVGLREGGRWRKGGQRGQAGWLEVLRSQPHGCLESREHGSGSQIRAWREESSDPQTALEANRR